MRAVQRGHCPQVLDGPDSQAAQEHAAAATFFSDPDNAERSFKGFASYKDPSVVSALARIFRDKCAYCESRIGHIMPSEVEHYRPKAGYYDPQGNLKKPGYHWLAAAWENLLLVCIDCNRPRYHADGAGGRVLLGKGNHFPLDDEAKRAVAPGDEVHERPLLLNPCVDAVEDYFEFTDGGAIRPSASSGLARDRALATIRIIGLQRWKLAKRREEVLLRVEAQIRKYLEARQDYEDYPDHPAVQRTIAREIADLKSLWGEEDEFSLMVRQRIEEACPEALGA